MAAFSNAYVAVRSFLALVWWHLCHFLAHNLHVRGIKPSSQFFHKVVIIGDDFAAGVGDYITMGGAGGGLAEYLKKIVAYDDKASDVEAENEAAVPAQLRQRDLAAAADSKILFVPCRRSATIGPSSTPECLDPRPPTGSCLRPRRLGIVFTFSCCYRVASCLCGPPLGVRT
jgi:hypothetical protein